MALKSNPVDLYNTKPYLNCCSLWKSLWSW